MSDRARRRDIAQETLQIIQQGFYRFNGRSIDICNKVIDCASGSVHYPPPTTHHRHLQKTSSVTMQTQYEVVNEGTLDAAQRLAAAGWPVAALNFASAKHPGGGFLNGAEAQEENLARNSALYASLTSVAARDFYGKPKSALYADNLIYSPGCPVIRDGRTGALLPQTWQCSFITAAAPNAGIARVRGFSDSEITATLRERADRVLGVAVERGHTAIVLGAWGCGVFKNEPDTVAQVFAQLLREKYAGRFAYCSFAVCGPEANRAAFAMHFGREGRMLIRPLAPPTELFLSQPVEMAKELEEPVAAGGHNSTATGEVDGDAVVELDSVTSDADMHLGSWACSSAHSPQRGLGRPRHPQTKAAGARARATRTRHARNLTEPTLFY